MQHAYQALRVISEAQTVHIILTTRPDELLLKELGSACAGLHGSGDDGIKAVILDFSEPNSTPTHAASDLALLVEILAAIRALPQPVLAVARASLSPVASRLLAAADFTLVAHEARLYIAGMDTESLQENEDQSIGSPAAARLGHITWTARAEDVPRELERILDLLRDKSALALRQAKASVRLAQQADLAPLDALQQVSQFYLQNITSTENVREELYASLEKRQSNWKNR